MKVWLPETPFLASIGELPGDVDLAVVPREGALPSGFAEVEFLVPPYGSRRVLDALPNLESLRVLQVDSAGVDWIERSLPEGVTLCNARGTRDAPVAEWVVAAILASYKQFPRFHRQQQAARWEPEVPRELTGSRALIVGYGSIGRAVEQRLLPFGVEVIRVASRRREGVHGIDEIDELLPRADIAIVLLPATPQTAGLFDRERLRRLAAGTLLVNAGRGAAVNTEALVEELKAERLYAALDVADPEPLPPDHPLWSMPNVLITPHVAGDSELAERRVYELVGDQIRRCLRGEPLVNVVDLPDPTIQP